MPEVWPFEPEDRINAKVRWNTEVLAARSAEQRIRLAPPRLSLGYTHTLWGDRMTQAKMIMEKSPDMDFLVPDWRYAQETNVILDGTETQIPLDETSMYLEPGDDVLVWRGERDYATGAVLAAGAGVVTLAAPIGRAMVRPVLAPLLAGYAPRGFSWRTASPLTRALSCEFHVYSYKDLSDRVLTETIYQSYPVLLDRTMLISSISGKMVRTTYEFDNGKGNVELEPIYDHADYGDEISFLDTDRRVRFEREVWIHKRYGRQKPFWLPTWSSDHELMETAAAAQSNVVVRAVGVETDYLFRRILISQKSGTTMIRSVVAVAVADGEATLTLDSPLDEEVSEDSVQNICDVNLVRLDTDEIDMNYGVGLQCGLTATVAGLNDEL